MIKLSYIEHVNIIYNSYCLQFNRIYCQKILENRHTQIIENLHSGVVKPHTHIRHHGEMCRLNVYGHLYSGGSSMARLKRGGGVTNPLGD